MVRMKGIRQTWRRLLGRRDVEQSVSDELAFHLEMSARKIAAEEGLTEEAAWDEALRRFGPAHRIEAECAGIEEQQLRRQSRMERAADLVREWRLALRNLGRNPGFTLLSVLILAIGIGAVTLMFTTLNALLLRPLPYPEPDRLVWVWSTTASGNNNSTSALDYFDFRERCDAFQSLSAEFVWQQGRVFTGAGEPTRINTRPVSHEFFETMGIPPLLGRGFLPEEEVLGGPDVVVLSNGFWQRYMGGDRASLGSTLTLDGMVYQVVGIMPAGFDFPMGTDLWFPMKRGGGAESGRGNNNFLMVGRLKKGVLLKVAQMQLDRVAADIAADFPDVKKGWGARAIPLQERLYGNLRAPLIILMSAVVALLAIACANISSLFLAKLISRRKEFAVRRSLGASRGAIIRQLLTESLTITAIGAAGGVGLAALGLRFVKVTGPMASERLQAASLDGTVLAVTALSAIAASLLFGVIPAVRSSRQDLVSPLKDGSGATIGTSGLRTRAGLVVVQVALSTALLLVSGLLIRSLVNTRGADLGFDPESVLTADFQIAASRYPDREQGVSAILEMVDRTRALPGVIAAAGADGLPLFSGPYNSLWRPDKPPEEAADRLPALRRFITEDYFNVLDIPFLGGRDFSPSDRAGSPNVTIVSKAFADALFPEGDALGGYVALPWGEDFRLQIVGVVRDVRDDGATLPVRPVFYLPYRQYPGPSLRLIVKSSGDPDALVPAVRSAIWGVDDQVPLTRVGTMETWFEDQLVGSRFQVTLLVTFAVIALILAGMGLYGIMAYFVNERRIELGIRVVLGASPRHLTAAVMGRSGRLVAVGLFIGLVIGTAAGTVMRSMLFELSPIDPGTYIAVLLVLAVIGLVAGAVPTTRALKVDPASAMRIG